MNKQLLTAVIPFLLAACASTDPTPASASREERAYRTGSNLPVRDPVSSSPTTVAAPPEARTGTPAARTN